MSTPFKYVPYIFLFYLKNIFLRDSLLQKFFAVVSVLLTNPNQWQGVSHAGFHMGPQVWLEEGESVS